MDAIAYRIAINPKFLEPTTTRELDRIAKISEAIGPPTPVTAADYCYHHERQLRTPEATHQTRKVELDAPVSGRKTRMVEEAGVPGAIVQSTTTENAARINMGFPCRRTTTTKDIT